MVFHQAPICCVVVVVVVVAPPLLWDEGAVQTAIQVHAINLIILG